MSNLFRARVDGCIFISSSLDLLRGATMLADSQKTKLQLIEELESLRSRVAAFEQPARGEKALQQSDFLQALYATAPVGLCYLDTELRFVFINEWLADINGLSVEQHMGRRVAELLPDVAAGVESQLRHVIETGEPILDGTVVAETPAHPEVKRHFQHNYLPVKSNDGTVVGISCVVQDVTERKRADEQLKRFRAALDICADAVLLIDRNEMRFTDVNDTACTILGYSRGELLRLGPQDVKPGYTKKELERRFDEIIQIKPEPTVLEIIHQRKDGSQFPAEVSLRAMEIESKHFLLAVVRDITERKQAEESLRLTQFALDHAADPIYWVREDGRIFYANNSAYESLGYSRDELLSMSVSEIDPDFPTEGWPAHWQQMKKSGRLTFESHHRTKDGHVFPVEITTNYLTKGRHEFIWGYVHDITKRKRAEQKLRFVVEGTASATGEDFYGSLVKYLAAALNVQFAFVSEVVDAEAKRLRLLAYWTGTGFGPNFEYDIMDTPCAHVVGKGLAGFAQGVQERFPKDIWLKENGIESYLAIPLFDLAGRPLGYLGVADQAPMEEITLAEPVLRTFAARASGEIMRRRAEDLLRQRERELAHVARLSTLGEMIAGVSHELGQPLFAIMNYVEVCSKTAKNVECESCRKLVEWIGEITKSAERAGDVVRRLRQFSIRGQSKRERLRIDEIISDSVSLLRFELRYSRINLTVTPSPGMEGLEVCVDRVQIQQVLVNLLHNACHAVENTPEPDRQILVRFSRAQDAVEVAVEDRGTGIPAEDVAHIFEAFFTTKDAGMGLGLAISKRIMEDHGGRIWWKSNPEGGTTFHFTLPLEK